MAKNFSWNGTIASFIIEIVPMGDTSYRKNAFPVSFAPWEAECRMAHKIAKLLLEQAGSFLERTQAIAAALSLGMPLHEIEEYLDWLDATAPTVPDGSVPPNHTIHDGK